MDDFGNALPSISSWDVFRQGMFYMLGEFGMFDCSYWPLWSEA